MTRKKAFGALFVALAALGGAACRRGLPRFSRPPVVLISIDTLRADHLPMYGYAGVETPALSALRKDSILYTDAVAHVPLTLPSHTTVMTGLLPPQSAVRDNTGYALPADRATLAAELKKNGYATGGAVSTVVLIKSSGISRGFDFYDDDIEAKGPGLSIAMIQRSGMDTERVLEGWMSGVERGPFFAFLHLYEPHTPYEPPEPYKSRYPERPYDGEIATADAVVGKFVEALKRAGVYEKALVILMSDHGEGLGDHGEEEHGVLLYRDTLHVPLMVKLPGQRRAGESVDRVVGLVDIFPTIMDVLGDPVPTGLAGRSLLGGAGAGERDVYSETLYPRYHYGWSDLAALTRSKWEYIRGGSDEELYDYESDPGEKKDLARGLPPAFRSMRNVLAGISRPRQAPGASDPEQLKKLAALGYLGSASPPETAENLPSPRLHIGELGDLKEVMKLYSQKKYEESIRAARQLLRKNPQMSDVWATIANSYHKMGLNAEAIEALKQQDRLSPGSPITLSSFAAEYLEMGDLDQAKLYAERAIAVNGPAEAHEVLATVYLRRKDYDAAEKEAAKAQGGYRQRRKPQMILAQVAKARGDLAGALAIVDDVLRKAEEKEGDLSNVNYLRGDILARLGRNAEAEAAFKEEIKTFSNNGQAWTALALLYASEGRSDDARRTLTDFARTSPGPRTFQAIGETFEVLGSPAEGKRWKTLARQAGFRGSLPSGS